MLILKIFDWKQEKIWFDFIYFFLQAVFADWIKSYESSISMTFYKFKDYVW